MYDPPAWGIGKFEIFHIESISKSRIIQTVSIVSSMWRFWFVFELGS